MCFLQAGLIHELRAPLFVAFWGKDVSGRHNSRLTGAFLASLVAKEQTISRITVHMVQKNVHALSLIHLKKSLLTVNGPITAFVYTLYMKRYPGRCCSTNITIKLPTVRRAGAQLMSVCLIFHFPHILFQIFVCRPKFLLNSELQAALPASTAT